MTTQAVRPGQLLAGRYLVEDLLDEADGVRSWRAIDEVLSRAVFVHTLSTDDPRAEALSEAARGASQVGDPRFLQVLDVDAESDAVYVVREWITGQNLKSLLADGPMNADQAAVLGREVAEALTIAHSRGLTHCRLEPSSVVIAPNGTVKVAGLATEAALHGRPEGDTAEIDAAGIGRILYAALTGRWPDGDGHGLPVAPRIEGRFASPRQVRPGVPKTLDEVVDRTLGNGERHHADPLATPAAVADALTATTTGSSLGNGMRADSGDQGWPPPAVIDQPSAPLFAAQASPVAQDGNDRPAASRTAGRVIGVVGSAAFLVLAFWLGLQLFFSGVDTPDRTADPGPAPTETEPPEEPAEDPEDETPDENGDEEAEPEPEAGLSLQADPSSVTGNQRITLSGQLQPGVDNIELRVERRIGDGDWEGFPDSNSPVTTRTRADGSFSTWVQTGRQGENEWRLVGTVDGERIESETVTVTVN